MCRKCHIHHIHFACNRLFGWLCMFHTANEELPFDKTRMSLLHDTDDQYLATSQRLFAMSSHHINWRTGFGRIMIKVDWNQKVLTNDGVFQWWSFTIYMCLSMMVFSMIIDVCLPWCSFSNFLRVDWNSWVTPWTTRPVGGKRCLGTSVFTLAPGDRKESKELPAPESCYSEKGKKDFPVTIFPGASC